MMQLKNDDSSLCYDVIITHQKALPGLSPVLPGIFGYGPDRPGGPTWLGKSLPDTFPKS